MRRPLGALVLTLALVGVAAGCGGDDVVGDVVPRSTPELTAPKDADLGSGASTTTTGTTTTDTTATTPTTPATGAAPSAPTPAPSTPPTGGAAPQTGDGTGGGAAPDTGGASPGAFSEFCRQNPGACPDQ